MEHKGLLGFLLIFFDKGAQAAREWLRDQRRPVEYVNLEDTLFEGREQAYGGYHLRRQYPWHLLTALALTVVGMSWMVILQRLTIPPGPAEKTEIAAYAIDHFGPPPGWISPATMVSVQPVDQQAYPVNYAEAVNQLRREYSCAYWSTRFEGTALLRIGADGRPRSIHLLKGIRGTRATLGYQFLSRLHFQPATFRGRAVESWLFLPYSF